MGASKVAHLKGSLEAAARSESCETRQKSEVCWYRSDRKTSAWAKSPSTSCRPAHARTLGSIAFRVWQHCMASTLSNERHEPGKSAQMSRQKGQTAQLWWAQRSGSGWLLPLHSTHSKSPHLLWRIVCGEELTELYHNELPQARQLKNLLRQCSSHLVVGEV